MAEIKSVKELIEMKSEINDKRCQIKSLNIPSLGTDVKFKLASRPEIVQAMAMDNVDLDPYIIFTHVIEPNLADKDLQDAYNKGRDPFKIVDEIMDMEEVGMLSMAIAGKYKGDMVKDVKNS